MPRKPKKPKRRQRGSGSIVTLASGVIRARLPPTLDARRTAREFRPGQLAEAEAWLASYLNPQPAVVNAATVTVADWTATWFGTYIEPIHPLNTARSYQHALAQLEPLYPILLPDVRQSALQGIVGTITARLQPGTVQSIVGVWRRCFEAAIDDELIARNPAKRLALPKVPQRPPARHLTPEEVVLLRTAIVGVRFEAAYALMLGCGLRIGEILGLHWEHVNLTNRQAWIQHQYTNGYWRPLPKASNPHWIPLPPFVVAALVRHRKTQPAGSTLVMQSPHSGPLRRKKKRAYPWSRSSVVSDLAAILVRLGIDHATPHSGRHGLASVMMDAGVPAVVVAQRLGNTAAVVQNIYGHPLASGQQHAADVVDEYLGSGPAVRERDISG